MGIVANIQTIPQRIYYSRADHYHRRYRYFGRYRGGELSRGQRQAANTAVLAEFQAWRDVFATYHSRFGRYPTMPANSHFCLGTGFPDGKCRDYTLSGPNTYLEADSAPLLDELRKAYITVPAGPKYPVNGTVGPYATFMEDNSWVGMTIVLHGNGPSDCPKDTAYIWDDGAGRLLCEYAFPLTPDD